MEVAHQCLLISIATSAGKSLRLMLPFAIIVELRKKTMSSVKNADSYLQEKGFIARIVVLKGNNHLLVEFIIYKSAYS